ncbi:LysE family translocator [Rhizobium sp. FKY42]|uniref:LysE family translocator n=1 Tax=Rhizobium sp. FKY42 TaxID=2562310 RepID=UPI0010C13CFF|nr:LysE family translocator [Rhizobium sp. FKY42]
MTELMQHWPQLVAAYSLYLVAVITPGPANLAIIGTAMNEGRKRAIVIALGIFTGSFTWAMAAALGLAAVLTRYGEVLQILKVVGGLYMLYLAFKAARSLGRVSSSTELESKIREKKLSRIYLTGYAIHLTNPKAIFGWLATISLGLPPGASAGSVVLVVCGCLLTGFTVFMSYAFLFSTERAASLYRSARRPLDALMALAFGAAGVKMISSAL